MEIFDFLNTLILIAIVAIMYAGVRAYLKNTAPIRQHKTNKRELSRGGVIHDEEAPPAREAAQQNFQFMGLPRVDAGQHIINVPDYDPDKSGKWEGNQEVLTTFVVEAYTKNGLDPLEAAELSKGYFLISCAGSALIMNSCSLSTAEADQLQVERKACLDTDGRDQFIDNFMGFKWKIVGAYGTNPLSTGKKCSFLQVLSKHSKLGDVGMQSVLPPSLMDMKEHDYFDLRARQLDADGQPTGKIMFAFYTGGKWNLLIGRKLDETEKNRLQAI